MSKPNSSRRRFKFVLFLGLSSAIGLAWFVYRSIEPDREAQIQRVAQAIEERDFETAMTLLEELYQRDESDLEVINGLVELCLIRGDEPQAIDWLMRMPDSTGSKAVDASFRAAQIALNSHRAAKTLEAAHRCLTLNPEFEPARRLLIHLNLILTRWEEMRTDIAELDRLGQARPSDVVLWCLGRGFRWTDGSHIEWLEAAFEQTPDDHFVRAALAYHYRFEGRRAEAADLLAHHAQPTGAGAWRIELARCEDLEEQGKIGRAFQESSALPKEANGSLRTWVLRGRLFTELGQTAKASQCYRNAWELDPFDNEPIAALTRLLAARDQEAAIEWRQRAKWNSRLWYVLSHSEPLAASGPGLDVVIEIGRWLVKLDQPRLAMICLEPALKHPNFAQDASELMRTLHQSHTELPARLQVCRADDLRPVTLDNIEARTKADRPDSSSSGEQPSIELVDIAGERGINFSFFRGDAGRHFLPETLGGGIAVMDYDLDGWPDLYFSQGRSLTSPTAKPEHFNCLYRNLESGSSKEVASAAGVADNGYGQGCGVVDYNNDGFPDLLVANHGDNLLYENNGDGTFSDVTESAGLKGGHWSTSVAAADFDRDGDADFYIVNYVQATLNKWEECRTGNYFGTCRVMDFPAVQDQLWINQGDGTFVDGTIGRGVQAEHGKGLGVIAEDFDDDGWIDLFVGNDTTANFLFHNRGESEKTDSQGKTWLGFEERGLLSGVAYNSLGVGEACMGIASQDIDQDGTLDLFVTNYEFETNTFYANRGGLLFEDQTPRLDLAVVSRPMLAWGAQFLDLDADRDWDLFIANGHLYDKPMRPQLFRNDGSRFTEITDGAGPFFQSEQFGRAAAIIDWNRDLAADLVVGHLKSRVALLKNASAAQNRLVVHLIGRASNRDAKGARVKVSANGKATVFRSGTDGGYFAASQNDIMIGLGAAETVETLEVAWPSGTVETWRNLAVGNRYLLIEGNPVALTAQRILSLKEEP